MRDRSFLIDSSFKFLLKRWRAAPGTGPTLPNARRELDVKKRLTIKRPTLLKRVLHLRARKNESPKRKRKRFDIDSIFVRKTACPASAPPTIPLDSLFKNSREEKGFLPFFFLDRSNHLIRFPSAGTLDKANYYRMIRYISIHVVIVRVHRNFCFGGNRSIIEI